jgi:hypothetical protein
MKTGLESLDTGASKITYEGNEGPKSPQQMAMADPLLVEEYQKYVFDMEEQGLQPMSFEEFVAQARAGMNEGGIADITFSRVQPSKDGSRPGYRSREVVEAQQKSYNQSSKSPGRQDPMGSGYYDSPKGRQELKDQSKRIEQMRQRGEGVFASDDLDEQAVKTDKLVKKLIPTIKTKDDDGFFRTFEKKLIDNFVRRNKYKHLIEAGLYSDFPGLAGKFLGYMSPDEEVDDFDMDSMREIASIYGGDLTPKQVKGLEGLRKDFEFEQKYPNPTTKDLRDYYDLDKDPGQGGDGPPPIIYPYPTSTAMAPAVVPPVVPPVETANPFLPATNLPFATYGTAPHGAKFGVDTRMFADGGRIGYQDGGNGDRNSIYQDVSRFLYGKDVQDLTDDEYLRLIKFTRENNAQGGRIGYAGGGIADLRQGYFLGKLVKKIGKGIKKVIKSPIGKAALGAALFKFGPQLLTGEGFGLGNIKKFRDLKFFGEAANVNPMRLIGGLSALPLIFGESQEEEEPNYYADASNIFDKYSPDKLRQMALAGTLPQNEYPFQSYYAADGGRVGLMNGGNPRFAALNKLYNINDEEEFSKGGSAGLPPITAGVEGQNLQSFSDDETPAPTQQDQMPRPMPNPMMMAGRINPMMMRGMNPMMMRGMNPMMARGMMPRMMAQEGGLMDLGGMEKDYRNEGGFVPIGGQERADDVPARLSKNEFVFTADAVRAAGGGDIDKGAEVMENMMENLEKGGKVSEESQGLKGARDMFATAQRLEGVL